MWVAMPFWLAPLVYVFWAAAVMALMVVVAAVALLITLGPVTTPRVAVCPASALGTTGVFCGGQLARTAPPGTGRRPAVPPARWASAAHRGLKSSGSSPARSSAARAARVRPRSRRGLVEGDH